MCALSAAFSFSRGAGSLALPTKVASVVPGDFNYDGKLDLLVLSEAESDDWWSKSAALKMEVYLQDPETGKLGQSPSSIHSIDTLILGPLLSAASTPLAVGDSALTQPLVVDATGDLRPDLLGFSTEDEGKTSSFKLWKNGPGGFFTLCVARPAILRVHGALTIASRRVDPPLNSAQVCRWANPHSNAFIDLDGDCLAGKLASRLIRSGPAILTWRSTPDIFLQCSNPYSRESTYQIWTNNQAGGFVLAREGELPKGAGAVSFADVGASALLHRHRCYQLTSPPSRP